MTLRSRVTHSSYWASQVPHKYFLSKLKLKVKSLRDFLKTSAIRLLKCKSEEPAKSSWLILCSSIRKYSYLPNIKVNKHIYCLQETMSDTVADKIMTVPLPSHLLPCPGPKMSISQFLNLGVCWVTWQKELCRCVTIKDLEMGELYWIIQVGSI